MLINAMDYIENVLDFRSTVLHGRNGAGKTLLAVATAQYLLDTGRVRRVMSNIPVTFASSPHPDALIVRETADGGEHIEYNFQHETAYNTCYIFDEAWVGLGDYDRQGVRDMFAYPRKNNQIFLMTSVLELQGVSRYVFHYIKLSFSMVKIGVPFRVYQSSILSKFASHPSSFAFLLEGKFYGIFDTDARPTSLNPVEQKWATGHRFVRQKQKGNFVTEGEYELHQPIFEDNRRLPPVIITGKEQRDETKIS